MDPTSKDGNLTATTTVLQFGNWIVEDKCSTRYLAVFKPYFPVDFPLNILSQFMLNEWFGLHCNVYICVCTIIFWDYILCLYTSSHINVIIVLHKYYYVQYTKLYFTWIYVPYITNSTNIHIYCRSKWRVNPITSH